MGGSGRGRRQSTGDWLGKGEYSPLLGVGETRIGADAGLLMGLVARDGGSCFWEALIFSAKQETGHVLSKGSDRSRRFGKHGGGWNHSVTWQSEVGRKQTSRQHGGPGEPWACVQRVPP